MKIFQVVVFTLTIVNAICSNKRSTNEDLQNFQLNQGEYIPSEEELKEYDAQYGNKLKNNRYNSPHQQEAHPSPGRTPHQLPQNVAFAAVHQTKIMPVKVIRDGPVKHVFLPKYYNDQPAQMKSSRTARTFDMNQAAYNTHYQYNGYNPGQYQQNYFRPSLQYNFLPASVGINQASIGHNYNPITSGYRVGKSNEITPLIPEYGSQFPSGYLGGFGNNLFAPGAHYLPQTFSSQIPSYQSGYQQIPQFATNVQQQYSQGISDQYKSIMPGASSNNAYTTSQYGQSLGLTSTIPNNFVTQNSYTSGREAKLTSDSGLDPELANIVNEVLKGKGTTTHDGFTMIKSKKDNAIYLIGKPGMSLNTIPNFSSYNYASFQNSDETAETKTEEKKST